MWPSPSWEVCTTNIVSRGLRHAPDVSKSPRSAFLAEDNLLFCRLECGEIQAEERAAKRCAESAGNLVPGQTFRANQCARPRITASSAVTLDWHSHGEAPDPLGRVIRRSATPDSPSRKCDSTKPEFPFRTTNRGRLIRWRFSKVFSGKNRGKWKPGECDHL